MPRFFGLTPEHKEDVILEPFFALGYYFGMSWETYYDFPISYKHWLVKRIEKEIKRGNDSDPPQNLSKAPHHNTSDVKALTGHRKPFVESAKMHRFT